MQSVRNALPSKIFFFQDKTFSISTTDSRYIIPVIRRAKVLNPSLTIVASPWTAPLWLKDPPGTAPNQLGDGTLIGTDQAYETYSNYFVKFVQEYRGM